MATPDHTPHGRGYMTALHYYHHANDYYTSVTNDCSGVGVVDLWQTNIDRAGFQGPANQYNNTCCNPGHSGHGGGTGPVCTKAECPFTSDGSCIEGACSRFGAKAPPGGCAHLPSRSARSKIGSEEACGAQMRTLSSRIRCWRRWSDTTPRSPTSSSGPRSQSHTTPVVLTSTKKTL